MKNKLKQEGEVGRKGRGKRKVGGRRTIPQKRQNQNTHQHYVTSTHWGTSTLDLVGASTRSNVIPHLETWWAPPPPLPPGSSNPHCWDQGTTRPAGKDSNHHSGGSPSGGGRRHKHHDSWLKYNYGVCNTQTASWSWPLSKHHRSWPSCHRAPTNLPGTQYSDDSNLSWSSQEGTLDHPRQENKEAWSPTLQKYNHSLSYLGSAYRHQLSHCSTNFGNSPRLSASINSKGQDCLESAQHDESNGPRTQDKQRSE